MNPQRIRFLSLAAPLVALCAACTGDNRVGAQPGPGGLELQASDAPVSEEAGVRKRNPKVCCGGANTYAVWTDDRNDPGGDKDIYFSRSTDGGVTWSAPVRLDTSPPGTADSNTVEICCSGDRVYVVWADARDGADDIYFNASEDGGATWMVNDVRLDTDAAGQARSRTPKLCCDGLAVRVAWVDERDDPGDIYATASTDGGNTWGANVRVDTDSGLFEQRNAQICCAGINVYVAWQDARSGFDDIHFNVSTDGGASFLPADVRVDVGEPPGDNNSFDPALCCEGDNVYVAWEDLRNGALRDIFLNYSRDGGVTWQAAPARIDTDAPGSGFSENVRLCCSGDNVYAVWRDQRDSPGNAFIDNTWFNASNDGGVTWGTDQRLDTTTPGTSETVANTICCLGDSVFVVWVDFRGGVRNIRANWSTDAGATFFADDVLVNASDAGSESDPNLCCDGTRVTFIWADERGGSQGIRARGSR